MTDSNRDIEAEEERFCDGHCTWLEHHPDCPLARRQNQPQAGDEE